jgi:hypothetical protein
MFPDQHVYIVREAGILSRTAPSAIPVHSCDITIEHLIQKKEFHTGI